MSLCLRPGTGRDLVEHLDVSPGHRGVRYLGIRLNERGRDVLDWIDYRPDARFWTLFAIPPMLSVAWAYGGWIGFGVLLGSALLLTSIIVGLAGVGILAWITVKAIFDLISAERSPTRKVPVISRSSPQFGR